MHKLLKLRICSIADIDRLLSNGYFLGRKSRFIDIFDNIRYIRYILYILYIFFYRDIWIIFLYYFFIYIRNKIYLLIIESEVWIIDKNMIAYLCYLIYKWKAIIYIIYNFNYNIYIIYGSIVSYFVIVIVIYPILKNK